jgi:hypothetical protein
VSARVRERGCGSSIWLPSMRVLFSLNSSMHVDNLGLVWMH